MRQPRHQPERGTVVQSRCRQQLGQLDAALMGGADALE